MRSNPIWFIQGGLDPRHSRTILEGVAAEGVPHLIIPVVPFDPEPPQWGPRLAGPIIINGSTKFRELAGAAGFRPGAFYDEGRFSYSSLWNRYGDHLLNNTGRLMTVTQFLDLEGPWDEEMFVRPMLDSKSINGGVRTRREWVRLLGAELGYGAGPILTTELIVSRPKVIEAEWRTFIVDGAVVASSRYRLNGHLSLEEGCPEEVRRFATERAAEYAPAPVFALDVAATPDGLRVVETGTFGCAGLYHADPAALVRAVTDYTATHY